MKISHLANGFANCQWDRNFGNSSVWRVKVIGFKRLSNTWCIIEMAEIQVDPTTVAIKPQTHTHTQTQTSFYFRERWYHPISPVLQSIKIMPFVNFMRRCFVGSFVCPFMFVLFDRHQAILWSKWKAIYQTHS